MTQEKIKTDIVSHVQKRHSDHKKLSGMLKKVNEELTLLSSTEGIESKNNLENFYKIWQNNKDQSGDKNDIQSWTAFFLGMTSCKPTGEFMPDRRVFARAGFPDIDTDFDYEDRDSVYAYIIDKYGRENVGNIGTHGLLKFKSCVTRVVKALDLAGSYHKGNDAYVSDNAAKVSEILSPFPKGGLMKVKGEDGENHLIQNFEDAYEHCADFKGYVDKYEEHDFKKYLEQIEGTFANFGCLASNTPILTSKGNIRIDQLSTKFSVAYVNKYGKIDYTDKFNSFKTGKKKVYRMRLSSNAFIDVTDEHLIFTDKGCIKFEKIRKNKKKYKIYGLKEEKAHIEEKAFPVMFDMELQGVYKKHLGCPSWVKWSQLDESWAKNQHSQSLEKLASRGGLHPLEVMANLKRVDWREVKDMKIEEVIPILKEIEFKE